MRAAAVTRTLYAHRHQHIKRALGLLVGNESRRTRVGELEHGGVTVELSRNVEQIARVEADIERLGIVADLELLDGAARIRIGDRKHQLSCGERELHGTAALARNRRHAIDRLLELVLVYFEALVVADRDDPAVVRER